MSFETAPREREREREREIERGRERETASQREREMYICICIHIYVHIYIYIERERDRASVRERAHARERESCFIEEVPGIECAPPFYCWHSEPVPAQRRHPPWSSVGQGSARVAHTMLYTGKMIRFSKSGSISPKAVRELRRMHLRLFLGMTGRTAPANICASVTIFHTEFVPFHLFIWVLTTLVWFGTEVLRGCASS